MKCVLLLTAMLLAALPARAFTDLSVTLQTSHAATALHVQLAESDEDVRLGLMHRDSVAPYDGMLFDFGDTRPISMWMKNTRIPLDMVFIEADGTIAGMALNTTPYSEASILSPVPVRYVLELPAGMATTYGIQIKDRLLIAP